ncbi:MAG: YitT family protein [Oscillospiraceae bacterium]|nr:YitT family protein [Oscillospiraceae bacterium]
MNHNRFSWAKNVAMEILGSVFVAIGVYNFAVAAQFPMTGFSGIALIFYRLWGFPIGLSTVILNIPVAIFSYRLLGKGFFLRSVRCTLISSLIIDCVAPLFPLYSGDRMLAALCTGAFSGLGYAIIYMQNSSTGGSDFIIMSVKALRPHLSMGKITFVIDVSVVVASGIIFKDMNGLIYGIIISFLMSAVIDRIMYGSNAGKLSLTVTEHPREVIEAIDRCCSRGATVLRAEGGYQGDQKGVVMCACNNKQMYEVQKAVKEADPSSFLVVLESNEVHGEGFSTFTVGEKSE